MAETAQATSTTQGTATEQKAALGADPASRLTKAQEITRRHVLWALGAGVVPFPVVDVLAVMAVHVKMLKEFSDLYGVQFREGAAKKLLGNLLSSIGIIGIGSAIGGSLAKFVPLLGSTLGFISVPIVAGMATHAVGRVFTMHFEAGGTLLDFDPGAMRAYFKQEFDKAKDSVTKLQQDQQDKSRAKPA